MINKKCQYCGRPLAGEICPAHGYVGKDIGAPVPSTLTALRLVTAPIDPVRLPDFEYFFDAADPAGAPSPVENLSAQAGFTLVVLSWTLPSEAAWRTWKIFEGTTDGFAAVTPILTTDQMVVSIPHVTGSGPWYYKVRAVNSRDEESTDVQVGPVTMAAVTAVDIGPGSVLATALADNAVDLASAAVTGQIAAAQIADGAIQVAKLADGAVTGSKFALGIKTLQTLAELPALPNADYPPGTVIFIPNEGRLYRVEEAVDLIPIMTSNTAPSGVVVASSELDVGHAAWKAMNDGAGGWESTVADGTPWTLEYQFAVARVITWYGVAGCAADLTKSPKTWTYEGYNGSAWVVIDTQTNVTGWVAATENPFDIVNEVSYSRYRLNISAVNGATACGVDEIEMAGWMEQAPTYITNANVAADAAIAATKLDIAGVPTGAEMQWPVATPPTGWLIEDGSSQLIADFPDLSALIRSTYGGADGTHFYLPDGRGVVPVGYKAADANFGTLGGTGGEKTHLLTAAESGVVAHTHPAVVASGTGASGLVYGAASGAVYEASWIKANTAADAASAHNNLQPYRTRNFVIKT